MSFDSSDLDAYKDEDMFPVPKLAYLEYGRNKLKAMSRRGQSLENLDDQALEFKELEKQLTIAKEGKDNEFLNDSFIDGEVEMVVKEMESTPYDNDKRAVEIHETP